MNNDCPVCSSNDLKELFKLNYTFPKAYKTSNSRTVFSCKGCGFVRCADESNFDSYKEYSEQNNRYEGVDVGFYDCSYDYVIECIDKDAYILDVGCGKGFLLRELKTVGYKNLYGLDPSTYAIASLTEAGINGINRSVYNSSPEYEKNLMLLL